MSEPMPISQIEHIIRNNNPELLIKAFLESRKTVDQKLERSVLESMGIKSFIGYLINLKDAEINKTYSAQLGNYILPSDQIAWFDKNHADILAYGRYKAECLDVALADWLGMVRLHYPIVSKNPDTAIPNEDGLSREDLRILFALNAKYHHYYEPMAYGLSTCLTLITMTGFEVFLEKNYS